MKLRWVLFCLVAKTLAASGSEVAAQTKASTENPLLTLKGLVSLCERRDATSIATCGGYILGFVQGSHATQRAAELDAVAQDIAGDRVPPTKDGMNAAAARHFGYLKLFCARSSWSAAYVQAHVVRYASENPGLLNETLEGQMLKILAKAFPCGERK